jgi:Family of unknown function (DUF5684)
MLTAAVLAQESGGGGGLFSGAFVFVYLVWIVLVVVGWWKIFVKAGEPGWAAIVPIYNVYVMLKIQGRPWWWLLLLLIPCVNFVLWILLMLGLAKSFGKGAGFALGLIFLSPIFVMILGFGDARYQGPIASPS